MDVRPRNDVSGVAIVLTCAALVLGFASAMAIDQFASDPRGWAEARCPEEPDTVEFDRDCIRDLAQRHPIRAEPSLLAASIAFALAGVTIAWARGTNRARVVSTVGAALLPLVHVVALT